MSLRAISSRASSVCESQWRRSRSTSVARWASKTQNSTHSGSEDLPRPKPFTQANIEDRSRLTGLPKFARPAAKGDVQPEDVLTSTEIASIEAEVKEEIFKELTGCPASQMKCGHKTGIFLRPWTL